MYIGSSVSVYFLCKINSTYLQICESPGDEQDIRVKINNYLLRVPS